MSALEKVKKQSESFVQNTNSNNTTKPGLKLNKNFPNKQPRKILKLDINIDKNTKNVNENDETKTKIQNNVESSKKKVQGQKVINTTVNNNKNIIPSTTKKEKLKDTKSITTTTKTTTTTNTTTTKNNDDLDLDELFEKRKQTKIESKVAERKAEKETKEKLEKSKKRKLELEDDFFDSRGLNIKDRKYVDGLPVFTEEELGLDTAGEGGDTELCPFDCQCCL
ncbi:hypothetical protein DLAC_04969 [Tieghemostelium lacteum]|uniref:DUF1764 family protein n=1 Tax=Tieghemostelium lacteum TaxID=361077 RepID=A0A151ZI01_TIELA|nr:hypothetical protein DLAC_04969 [Tieghemostelium lacteum]|eukprot:KYQ93596.1 hypothetical protein DLAC_04969 [Tieghemostelium lacteum]